MEKIEFLEKLNTSFHKLVNEMDNKEIRFISGKNTFKGALLGFMEKKYYQREKLIKQGEIIYALTFKTWSNDLSLIKPYPTWVLFSPEIIFKENPDLYTEYFDRISKLLLESKEKRYKKINKILNDELGEPQYLQIPPEIVDNHILYVSTIFLRIEQNPTIKLGLNLIIMSPLISKEVIYLPDKYLAI